MRGHVVGAFERMVVRKILTRDFVESHFEIFGHIWVGIFVDCERR